MPTHQATFINDESKNDEFKKNDSRMIQTEKTPDGKITVTILHAAPPPGPIIYDSEEDFYKDWRLEKIEATNLDDAQDLIKHLKTKE
jgi:hypothetical protein